MAFREMTVGELRDVLAEFPDYYTVAPFIDGTAGVITGVRAHVIDTNQPVVLIGECDLAIDLIESLRVPHSRPDERGGA